MPSDTAPDYQRFRKHPPPQDVCATDHYPVGTYVRPFSKASPGITEDMACPGGGRSRRGQVKTRDERGQWREEESIGGIVLLWEEVQWRWV